MKGPGVGSRFRFATASTMFSRKMNHPMPGSKVTVVFLKLCMGLVDTPRRWYGITPSEALHGSCHCIPRWLDVSDSQRIRLVSVRSMMGGQRESPLRPCTRLCALTDSDWCWEKNLWFTEDVAFGTYALLQGN